MVFTITGYRPEWEKEIASIIAADYEQKAIDYDAKLREAASLAISTAEPGFAGIALNGVINGAGRLDCQTGVEINGRKFDICVDLLLHIVTIYESK